MMKTRFSSSGRLFVVIVSRCSFVDHERLAAGLILPPQSDIAPQRVVAGVVLDERARNIVGLKV